MTSSRIIVCFALFGAALALGGCETTSAGAPALAAPSAAAATHEQVAMECWMTTEKTSAHLSLDKRADIVDRCIDTRMKAAPPPKP